MSKNNVCIEPLMKAVVDEVKTWGLAPEANGMTIEEGTFQNVVDSLSSFMDGMYYVRNIESLVKAVMFYVQHSEDNQAMKDKVQRVLEEIISNDAEYKENLENLSALRYGLCRILDAN